jgi:hypothetical protein
MDDYINPIDKLDAMIKCNKMIQHIYSLSSLKFEVAGVRFNIFITNILNLILKFSIIDVLLKFIFSYLYFNLNKNQK